MVARFVSHHNDRVGVVFILAVFNDNVVQILTHDIGCETHVIICQSTTNLTHAKGCETHPRIVSCYSYHCGVTGP